MILIIAEKPAVGKSIAKVLPGSATQKDGCIFCGDYVVVWAYGHLLELKQPDEYDPALKQWSLNTLPIYFEDWQQKPSEGAGARQDKAIRLKQIGDFLKKADSVIHAGDPDEEGQLIVDEILRWFNYKGPVKRINTADTTEEALSKAMRKLTDNDGYVNEGWSAYARSVADLTVGVNLTRFFSLHNEPAKLTVGRVQTPTLGMVINRDMQIEQHNKVYFYDIVANVQVDGKTVTAKYAVAKDDPEADENGRILSQPAAQAKADSLTGAQIRGIAVSKKLEQESPPLPFNLVKLQSYCSSKLGYSPTDVMGITQSLRDNHNAITYNRSDCQYLFEEAFDAAPATMDTVVKNIKFRPKQMDMAIKSRCFNNANVSAHHAIIPQNKSLNLDNLSEPERNVYLAICKYYMAQFMPPAKKERTRLNVTLKDGSSLSATSTRIVAPGYLAIFREAEKEEYGPLSDVAAGTYDGSIVSTEVEKKETKPPSRYTKATLNEDMTRIAKYVDDPHIKKLLLEKDKDKEGENGSIGTTATRSTIIDNLVTRGFLQEKGKQIISTPLAREFFRILPEELKKPDMTAFWWVMQEDIRAGTANPSKLTENVLEMVERIIKSSYPKIDASILPASGAGKGQGTEINSLGPCPRCGKPVVEGEKGFGCSGWKSGCKFTIWKKMKPVLFSKTNITKADVQAFLAGKPVKKNSLVKKDGSTFSAHLKMKDDPNSPYGPSFELDFSSSAKTPKGKKK